MSEAQDLRYLDSRIDDLRDDLNKITKTLHGVVIALRDSNERAVARWDETDRNLQQLLEQHARDKVEADKNYQQLLEQHAKDKAEADKNYQQLLEQIAKDKAEADKNLQQLKEENERNKAEAEKSYQQLLEQIAKDKAENDKNIITYQQTMKKNFDKAQAESGRVWGHMLENIVIDGLPVLFSVFELDFTSLARNLRYLDQNKKPICEYDFVIPYDSKATVSPRYLVGEIKSNLTSNNIDDFIKKLYLFNKAIDSRQPIEVIGVMVYSRTDDRLSQKEKKALLVGEQKAQLDKRIKQAEDAGLIVISAFGSDSFSLSKCMNKFDFQPKIFQLPEGTDDTKK